MDELAGGGAQAADQVAGVEVIVNQMAGTQVVDHCWCALHVDATYLVKEHTSLVVTPTHSLCRLRQLAYGPTSIWGGGRPSFARMDSVGFPGSIFCGGGGGSSRNFPGSIFCGVAEFFPLTAVTDPKFVLFSVDSNNIP